MIRHFSQISFHFFFLTATLTPVPLLHSVVLAQGPGPGVGAGENPWSDNSRTPFEIRMSGVINPETEGETDSGESLSTVTLGIAQFHETYQFEIVKIESPGNPQLSASQILQKKGKRQYDFELVGSSELLSKIAQAQPGAPLKIVGMYEQRDQRLQLVSVDIVGMDKY
jgi:hypothetical protein